MEYDGPNVYGILWNMMESNVYGILWNMMESKMFMESYGI